MRIANWSQFAAIFGDPANPEAGPFMKDAYFAHSVYGFFMNGRTLCWVSVGAPGNGNGSGPPQMAALPAAGDTGTETLRVIAKQGVEGPDEGQLRLEAHQDRGDGRVAARGPAGSEAGQVPAGRRGPDTSNLSSGDFEGVAAKRMAWAGGGDDGPDGQASSRTFTLPHPAGG